jgi:hypothetical protein
VDSEGGEEDGVEKEDGVEEEDSVEGKEAKSDREPFNITVGGLCEREPGGGSVAVKVD